MKASARSPSASREGSKARQVLVVAQVALSLVLLFGALIFTGTLRNLLAVDPGFQSENVAVARVDFSRMRVTEAGRGALTRELLDRIGALAA